MSKDTQKSMGKIIMALSLMLPKWHWFNFSSQLQLFIIGLCFMLISRIRLYIVIFIVHMEQVVAFDAQGVSPIWYVIFTGSSMFSNNHLVHGLGFFGLSPNSLWQYEVALVILCFIVILSKDVSVMLYMWMIFLSQVVIRRVLSN